MAAWKAPHCVLWSLEGLVGRVVSAGSVDVCCVLAAIEKEKGAWEHLRRFRHRRVLL